MNQEHLLIFSPEVAKVEARTKTYFCSSANFYFCRLTIYTLEIGKIYREESRYLLSSLTKNRKNIVCLCVKALKLKDGFYSSITYPILTNALRNWTHLSKTDQQIWALGIRIPKILNNLTHHYKHLNLRYCFLYAPYSSLLYIE